MDTEQVALKERRLVILLDFDGVMITTQPWRKLEILEDGFIAFNLNAANNLARIIKETNASIVLTTTHRIRFNTRQWTDLFTKRGLYIKCISLINETQLVSEMKDRATEVKEWIEKNGLNVDYIIIDDDSTLHNLPLKIKQRWVKTDSIIGLDISATNKVLQLVNK